MPFLIGTKKLIPAPFVTVAKQLIITEDGRPLNATYQITLAGTLVPHKGSPQTVGFWEGAGDPPDQSFTNETDKFNALLRKQELLRDALSATGYFISWSPPGKEPTIFYPTKALSMEFNPGNWVNRMDYQITLEAPTLDRFDTCDDQLVYTSGSYNLNLQSIQDGYQVSESDDGNHVLTLTRTTSAQSAVHYNSSGMIGEPWRNAKTWVVNQVNNVPFGSGYSSIIPTGGSNYNFIREEQIDIYGGKYTLTNKFIYHRNNYQDNRTITRQLIPNRFYDGQTEIETITVNGKIQGFDPSGSASGRLVNAYAYWNSIASGLYIAVGAYGPWTSRTLTEDYNLGILEYNVSFTNYASGTLYTHNYDVSSTQPTQGLPTVTIAGKIQGITKDDYSDDNQVAPTGQKIKNAFSGWTALEPTLRSLIFQYPQYNIGVIGDYTLLSNNKTLGFNRQEGYVTYSQTFTLADATGTASGYFNHDYTIDFDTSNTSPGGTYRGGLLVNARINGSIQGYSVSGQNLFDSRYNNAVSGWNVIKGGLYGLVNAKYSLIGTTTTMPPLYSGFVNRTVSTTRSAGTINYTATFNNLPAPSSSLVAVEDVTVENTIPNDIFAVQVIPGRSIGPIIQNIATISENAKNINITLIMHPQSFSTGYWNYGDITTPRDIASGIIAVNLPPGTRSVDWWFAGQSESWTPKAGVYNRTARIVY